VTNAVHRAQYLKFGWGVILELDEPVLTPIPYLEAVRKICGEETFSAEGLSVHSTEFVYGCNDSSSDCAAHPLWWGQWRMICFAMMFFCGLVAAVVWGPRFLNCAWDIIATGVHSTIEYICSLTILCWSCVVSIWNCVAEYCTRGAPFRAQLARAIETQESELHKLLVLSTETHAALERAAGGRDTARRRVRDLERNLEDANKQIKKQRKANDAMLKVIRSFKPETEKLKVLATKLQTKITTLEADLATSESKLNAEYENTRNEAEKVDRLERLQVSLGEQIKSLKKQLKNQKKRKKKADRQLNRIQENLDEEKQEENLDEEKQEPAPNSYSYDVVARRFQVPGAPNGEPSVIGGEASYPPSVATFFYEQEGQ